MAKDTPKPRRLKARRTTGRSAGISQSAFAGYGHQQPAPETPPTQRPSEATADDGQASKTATEANKDQPDQDDNKQA